jgi:pyruvate/2-oxoglutarate dehydrogenase complex dihydrolipoamide acyltransferase (E2) component
MNAIKRIVFLSAVVLAGTVMTATGASDSTAKEPAAAAPPPTAATPAVAAPDSPTPTVQAVWIEREASFVYMGQTTYYNCYGLRDKLRYILKQVGARADDLKVTVSCVETGGAGIETMPRVQIKAVMPTEATAELLQQLREDPKRELIARVRGEGDADLATAQFPAVPTLVQFDGSRRDRVEDGDCELLEHLVSRVFPALGVRVAEGSRLHCMRSSVPVGSVDLRLETLRKAPEPDAPAPAKT